jgi:hypothetical protein
MATCASGNNDIHEDAGCVAVADILDSMSNNGAIISISRIYATWSYNIVLDDTESRGR